MDINELWQKMDSRFTNIENSQNAMRKEQSDMKKEQSDMKKEQSDMKKEQSDMKKEQSDMKKEQSNMRKELKEIKSDINGIHNKLDIIMNSNLAQILNEQRSFRNEFTKKLDDAILKNNLEHKRFDYKIAGLEMNFKIAK